MVKLKIDKIENGVYYLEDIMGRIYHFNIQLYDIENMPKENDYIYLDEQLLSEQNSVLSFGALNSSYGRKISSENLCELLIIDNKKEKIYLKRLYG